MLGAGCRASPAEKDMADTRSASPQSRMLSREPAPRSADRGELQLALHDARCQELRGSPWRGALACWCSLLRDDVVVLVLGLSNRHR